MPPVALPALAFFDAPEPKDSALRTGGLPRLPASIDWPFIHEDTPFHFFADIDLAALPRQVEAGGDTYPLPDFPKTGHLFIFMPLVADYLYNEEPKVIYAADATEDTVERQPPQELSRLDDDETRSVVDRTKLNASGTGFLPAFYETRPIMSARAENPLWWNMERDSLSEEEIYRRDLAYAEQLKALGIDYDVPLPTPKAAREPLYEEIPFYFQGFFQRGVFQWTWEYIFEVCKRAYAGCHDLHVEEVKNWIEDGNDHPSFHRLIAKMEAKKAKIEAEKFSDRPGLWEGIACDHIPAVTMRLDVQLARWMGYARVMQKKPQTEEDKRAFLAMLAPSECGNDCVTKADLRVLGKFRDHRVRAFYVEQEINKAFKRVAQERTDLHPGRSPDPVHDFGDTDRAAQVVQMFGAGYLMQNAAIKNENKVLLFQIANGGGLELDGILQVWIAHEDLAAGRFDQAFGTFETT